MTAKTLLAFICGAGVGAGLTYFLMRDKVQKEIDILHEEYTSAEKKEVTPTTEEKKQQDEVEIKVKTEDADILAYAKNLAANRYTYETDEDLKSPVPHVIPMNDFGSIDGYGMRSYTYYEDGVVTDEDDVPLDKPSEVLGDDYEARFKRGGADVVYVRNDILENDYELVRCPDPYYYGDEEEGLDDIEDPHLKKGIDYDPEEDDEE